MIRKIIFFFPLQLLLVNLKRNHLLLLFWLILFGFVSNNFASKFGISFLFLAPEYLDAVSFWSYLIMGFAIGGFVMTFNISSYIINSKRFPFIAALKRPFLKFCINNSLLPVFFLIYYITQVVNYHIVNENSSLIEILFYVIAIIAGYTINILISLIYFLSTNQNIFKKMGINPFEVDNKIINSIFSRNKNILNILKSKDKWHAETYLHSPFKIKYARDISHYDESMLKSVVKQNHLNASLFELVIFTSLFILGLFSENPIFIIPAGASIILFFTIIFILMSAFYTWLKGWTTITIIGLFVLINYLSKSETFTYSNMAYGLNYETKKAEYSTKNLAFFRDNKNNQTEDIKNSIAILENWKKKNNSSTKPKIIFINTSGGGSRSALWTFYLLQSIDKLSKGKFINQTQLITGSSGGMIGAAYFRELYLERNELKESICSKKYLDNISKDLLNPIAFSIATNDFFFRTKKYNDGKYSYWKDRGYAFERQLLINTNYVLDKRLNEYSQPEYNSKIPMMIFSPTVINDARRMLISSQPISFLSNNYPNNNVNTKPIVENFEFRRLFKKQDADNLKFTSALRMSATFPLIMPRVSLPSEPQITVMDAGMRDNYGKINTYKYISTFKEWISENTSGVIIVSFRDKPKNLAIKNNSLRSITETFFSPLGSLYENLFPIQDYNQDDMLQYLGNSVDLPIAVFDFELDNSENNISLSWHLTTKEKEIVVNSIYSNKNKQSLEYLLKLIDD